MQQLHPRETHDILQVIAPLLTKLCDTRLLISPKVIVC